MRMVKAAIGVFEPSLPLAIPLDKWQRQQRHEGKAVGRAAFSDYRWSLWTNCFLLIYAAAGCWVLLLLLFHGCVVVAITRGQCLTCFLGPRVQF